MAINITLSELYRLTPLGDIKASIGSTLYGINHRNTPLAVPMNKDQHGLVLFTRPQLNLSTENIRSLRELNMLESENEMSLPRVIRKLLDPRLDLPCPFVDNKNPFIPLLTNHCLTCSGWPDPYLDFYTSKPGVYRESYSMVDSIYNINTPYDIQATFRNMLGNPIVIMLHVWGLYMSAVFRGALTPYPDFIAYNEVDYQTRIWRLVLDPTKRFVQAIGVTNVAAPKAVPLGQTFNLTHDRPFNHDNDQFTVPFQANGATYYDDILVEEFNKLVTIFNPDMKNLNTSIGGIAGDSFMTKIDQSQLSYFNNMGYPRIDPITMELQWWIDSDIYQAILTGIERIQEEVDH